MNAEGSVIDLTHAECGSAKAVRLEDDKRDKCQNPEILLVVSREEENPKSICKDYVPLSLPATSKKSGLPLGMQS